MVFDDLEAQAIQHTSHLYTERFTSAANTAVSETTAHQSPKVLRRVLVTFHDGADPPVQQTVANKVVTLTFISKTSDAYDHQVNTFTMSGETYEFLPDFIRNFKAGDQLLVTVTAGGANVLTSVQVDWAGGEV